MPETARLIVALGLQDNLSSGLGRATSNLNKMTGNLGQVGKGIGQVSHGLGNILTRGALAAGAALVGVVSTAASFEQAFTGVEKTVAGTDAQLAELEQTLRQMARTIPVSFEELSAIGEAGGALGVARDSLDEFIDVVARLSVSTNLDADAAATALGQLGTVLHLTGQDYEDFADSLVALGNAGASTEAQIVELAARFAAAGNSAGLSKEEILAISSAVASMGVEVEAGGTALSQTFNGITKAIGTGSDEVKAYTETLGISAAEFKKRWTEDALGTFQAFLGELAKLDKYKQSAILEKAGITGVRQTNAVMLMTQNLGFFSDQLVTATTATGALDRESQKFFDTAAGQWKVLRQNVKDAAATVGTELLPLLTTTTKELVAFLQLPTTQAGLKEFGRDLAKGIGDLKKELQGTDFSGLISGMKLAGEVARSAFDMFNKLPPEIRALAVGALAVNKLTGGAVTSIAKGLTNIVLGGIGVGGGLLGRGSSAANAVWVRSATGGVGGAAGGGGGFIGGLTKATIFGLVALAIGEFAAQNITRPMDPTQFDFNGVAANSGRFPNGSQLGIPAANRFAQKLADELGIPLEDVKQGIVLSVNDLGLTFDQAVAKLRGDVKGLKPGSVPKPPGPGARHPKGWVPPLSEREALAEAMRHRGTLGTGRRLPDTAFGGPDVVNSLLLPFDEQTRLLREISANGRNPVPVIINVGVPVYVNASLIQAKQYQILTAARLTRRGVY